MVSDSSDSRSSTASSSAAAAATEEEVEEDRMVTEELEAAEALAHLAMRAGDSGLRTSKRVKSESPPEISESPTLCQETTTSREQPPEKADPNVPTELSMAEIGHGDTSLKVEKEAISPNTNLVSSVGYLSPGCGKSRRNLTEVEKEERRIRRILANRESARQTIRRRQALCEELTKKAADLASENDSLKREMEMAMNEYQILETKNKELRDQMSKVESAEAEESPTTAHPACVHVAPSSASPLFLYNHPPFAPFFWPPVSQHQNPILPTHIPQNSIVMPSNIPFPVEARCDSCELECLVNTNPRSTPFYILPYPWFFPHADNGAANQSQRSDFQKNEQEETLGCPTPHLFLPIKVKDEPSGSQEARVTNDLNEPPEGFSLDEGDQHTNLASTTTVKNENGLGLNPTPHIETSPEFYFTPPASEEKYSEPVMYRCMKSTEVAAAAEARKKRKELTKLKNLHGRQCRMHC